MRIIAGRFKGFEVRVPAKGTRPTTDRTKEAVFSHLEAMGMLDETRVLDLYAGSGALGIEALSRGAQSLTAVELASQAASLLRVTFHQLKQQPAWQPAMRAHIIKAKAEQFAAHPQAEPFDVVFIDPPYAVEDTVITQILEDLVTHHAVADHSVIIVERSVRTPAPTVPDQWQISRGKHYGETAVYTIEHL